MKDAFRVTELISNSGSEIESQDPESSLRSGSLLKISYCEF